MHITDNLIHSTLRLECILHNGSSSVGTAFLFLFDGPRENERIPVLVTNKHVINNASIGKFIFTNSDKNNQPIYGDHIPFEIKNKFEDYWLKHPDTNVDLCIMPIGALLNDCETQLGKIPSIKGFSENELINKSESEQLTAFEEVFMIGYPNALWDATNNLPIIRRGFTATHPHLNYNGNKEFLVDMACFPGSSGSPIFQYISGMKVDKGGNVNLFGGSQIKLLGVLYAGPMFGVDGDIQVRNIPTSTIPIAHSKIPMNLGVVIKIEKLLEMKALLYKEYNIR